MVSLTLVSTVLMGLLVVATFVAAARIGTRRKHEAAASEGDRYDQLARRFDELAKSPAVWAVVFVAGALTFGLGAVAAFGGFGLSEGAAATALTVVYAVLGISLFAFVFLGGYAGARGRGLGNAQGVAVGAIAFGFALLFVIAAQLVIGSLG
ncbi:hypothetical protein GCM10027435_00740 [Haloparvum alkalitolerans]|uniref:hypothetical protein n=1 Tax=Haloparvum alkalitolerans TaxID=1042953 RepID=UPI003CEE3A03